MNAQELISIIKKEVVPATGCTEPVAIALNVAHAFQLVSGDVTSLHLNLSPNIYKNANAVGIPGTKHKGVKLAAALGVSIIDPTLDLTIFSTLSKKEVDSALNIIKNIPINLEIEYETPGVYIDTIIETSEGRGRAITSYRHDELILLQRDEEILLDKINGEKINQETSTLLRQYKLEELIEQIISTDPTEWLFLLEGINLNLDMARAGLEMDGGLEYGRKWRGAADKKFISNEITNKIPLYTAAASDARMAGIQLPVASSAGSGNQGLVAIIPISLAAEELNSSEEETARALAISHLVTMYIKEYTGRLSAVCGCGIAAGSGASAGLTYLIGGNLDDIIRAIKNMVSCLAGMICDGGKVGCALKLSTSAYMAWQIAILSKEGLDVPAGNGLVEPTIEATLENLGEISQVGMARVDKTIIDIMQKQEK